MTLRLDLINSMIATTGTSPLSADDTQHPDYIDASQVLDSILEEFSADAMWFNTEQRTLAVDGLGEITVPANALTCEAVDKRKHYRIRGTRLWDYDEHTYNIGIATEVRLLLNVALEDMPPIAIQWVRAAARYEFFVDKDGAVNKTKLYQMKLERMLVRLQAANLRYLNLNWFSSNAAANFYVRRASHSGRSRIVR